MTDPVIIIGAGRSGTKFLRDVLAAGRSVACVPYDVNYIWRYKADFGADDALDPAALTTERRDFIRRTLRQRAGIAPGDQQTVLIEKTVPNCLRVPYVAAVEPRARFVHLIRDGRDVTESAMRQWQSPPNFRALATKLASIPLANLGYAAWFAGNFARGLLRGRGGGAVWGPRYPGLDEDLDTLPLASICARQWAFCVRAATHDLAQIKAAGRVYELRYEALVADENALVRLLEALNLPDRGSSIARYRAQLKPDTGGRWRLLSAADREAMMAGLGDTLSSLGYASETAA